MVERSMARSSSSEQGGGGLSLPPGFRFHPTDEEVITSYLMHKFLDPSFVSRAVGEVDLNSCEPRDLPSKATMGEKEWYFFVHKDMKYPTGMRANRATREGYWKATGKDREIFTTAKSKNHRAGAGAGGELVGMKKTLVFYTGRAPRGAKTNWVMHEFRLDGKSRHQTMNNPKDEWVVCKVFNKKGEGKTTTKAAADVDVGVEYSAGTTPNASLVVDAGDFLDSMIDDHLYFTSSEYSSSFLPAKTTTTTTTANGAAPPYNADYYYSSVPTTAGSFNAMPNYSLTNASAASNTQMQVAALAKSVLPASGGDDVGSSRNMLNPAHGMGRRSYNVNHLHHHQDEHQVMVKALGGVIGPNFGVPPAKGLPSTAAITGVPPLQSKIESYDGEYAYGNYDLDAAMNGRPADGTKNFGARLLHY